MNSLEQHLPKNRPLFWSDAVLELFDVFSTIEPDTPIFLVGGAVRDAFLHRPIKDLDFVTPKHSIRFARKIANQLQCEMFVMDEERGVARVFVDTPDGKMILDISQYRGADLLSDLMERDFTMNAIAVDFRGDVMQIVDPLNGEADLEGHLVRRCAPHSIPTDPIRALRGIRQSVQLGFRIEKDTLADIRNYAATIAQTSPERIRDEFFNVLSIEKMVSAIRIAHTLGILEHVIAIHRVLDGIEQSPPNVFNVWDHTLYSLDRMVMILSAISPRRDDNTAASFAIGMLAIQLDRYRRALNEHILTFWANDRPHRSLLMLGTLLQLVPVRHKTTPSSMSVEQFADSLRLSNAEKKRLTMMVEHFPQFVTMEAYNPLIAHRFWYTLRESGIDVILLGLAHILGTYGNELPQPLWLNRVELAIQLLSAYYDLYDTIVEPPALVNGNDLMQQFGIPPSRMLGKVLDAIREAQVTGDVLNTEQALLFVKDYLSRAEADTTSPT